MSENLKSLIIAAGNGTRFSPLSDFVAKEFLPVFYEGDKDKYHQKNNGTPLITVIYNQLKDLGEVEVIISPEKKEDLDKLIKKYNMNISYKIQNEKLGDTSAIIKGLESYGIHFIHYGDLFYNNKDAKEEYKRAYEAIKTLNRNKPIVLYFTYPVEDVEKVKRMGVFQLDERDLNKVVRIVEKPKDQLTLSFLRTNNGWYVNSGVYLLKTNPYLIEVINNYLKRAHRYNKEIPFTKIVNDLLEKGLMDAYVVPFSKPEKFEDLGTFKDYIKHWSSRLNY